MMLDVRYAFWGRRFGAMRAAAMFLLIAVLCPHVPAQTASLIDEMRKKYNSTTSLQTQFNLEIFWKVREKTEKKSGTLYSAPGDKFRLELDKTIWVSDGRTYWQYSEASRQAVIKRLMDIDLSMHPSQIIKSYLINHTYALAQQSGEEAELVWKAGEADTKEHAREITLWVNTKKLVITKLVVVDISGNRSTYTFKKTSTAAIPAETFAFIIPEGASVLDARE